jgi:hypothetical protein
MDLSCAYAVSLISRLQWGQIGKITLIFAPKWTDFEGTAHFPILGLYTKPTRTEKLREISLIVDYRISLDLVSFAAADRQTVLPQLLPSVGVFPA